MDLRDDAVVVGVDGSGKDRLALDWAAAEAVSTGVSLHIAWAFDLANARTRRGRVEIDVDALGAEVVGPAVERVRASYPELDVTTHIAGEDPATVLVEASQRASFVVVGARGLGRIAGRLLGSVSQKVAAHAHCPVIVIRDKSPSDGPVVVGVDPWEVESPVIELAFDHARRHGATVRLIHVTQLHAVQAVDATVRQTLAQVATERSVELEAFADEWRAKVPDVPVETEVLRGHPINVLTEEAAHASLLVLGSRGGPGLTGVRLGSVALGVLHEAPLVAVVPLGAR